MSKKVGNVSFRIPQKDEFVAEKPYSEETAQMIDQEVRNVINAAYERTRELLLKHKDDVEKVRGGAVLVLGRARLLAGAEDSCTCRRPCRRPSHLGPPPHEPDPCESCKVVSDEYLTVYLTPYATLVHQGKGTAYPR